MREEVTFSDNLKNVKKVLKLVYKFGDAVISDLHFDKDFVSQLADNEFLLENEKILLQNMTLKREKIDFLLHDVIPGLLKREGGASLNRFVQYLRQHNYVELVEKMEQCHREVLANEREQPLACLKCGRRRCQQLDSFHVNAREVGENNADGKTALIEAVIEGDLRRFSALMTTTTSTELTAELLCIAAENGHIDLVEFLHSQLGAELGDGSQCLFVASRNGHADVVRFLLDHGADSWYQSESDDMMTPLMAACSRGHCEVISALLANEPNCCPLEARDAKYQTALAHAVLNDQLEAVRLLLKIDAINVNARVNEYLETPLILASIKGFTRIVDALLTRPECKLWADLGNRRDTTALMFAAYHGHRDVMAQLFDSGADLDVNATNYYNLTALMMAADQNHLACVNYLLDECPKKDILEIAKCSGGRNALFLAASNGSRDTARALLTRTAVDQPEPMKLEQLYDCLGFNVLMHAVFHQRVEGVRFLIEECHFDVNACQNRGRITPLSIACGGRNIPYQIDGKLMEIVEILLRAGARVDEPFFGRTPLMLAVEGRKPADFCHLLLEAGADPNSRCRCDPDDRTKTPVSIARKHAKSDEGGQHEQPARDLLEELLSYSRARVAT